MKVSRDIFSGGHCGYIESMLGHASKGKVLRIEGEMIVFRPGNTTYEMHLVCPDYQGPVNEPVQLIIRASARKVYTVPSGGLFVSPIMGVPKIVQGRVKDLTDEQVTLNCGVLINIDLPKVAGGIELARGPIETGVLVNAVLLAGTRAEWAPELAQAQVG